VCFGDYQKLIGNVDRIDNLLEHLHHQNINFLVLGRGMSNLLEILLYILSPSPITPFIFFVVSSIADYSNDRVDEETP